MKSDEGRRRSPGLPLVAFFHVIWKGGGGNLLEREREQEVRETERDTLKPILLGSQSVLEPLLLLLQYRLIPPKTNTHFPELLLLVLITDGVGALIGLRRRKYNSYILTFWNYYFHDFFFPPFLWIHVNRKYCDYKVKRKWLISC